MKTGKAKKTELRYAVLSGVAILLMIVIVFSVDKIFPAPVLNNPGIGNNDFPSSKVGLEFDRFDGTNPDAPVTLVEFSDFQCPFCGDAFSDVNKLAEHYGKNINVIYVHFPLQQIHPNALNAALASECARLQNKFWEYHDVLFMNQNTLDEYNLKSYASQLGLNQKDFNDCLDKQKTLSVIKSDFEKGLQAGVQGTPTFFVNGIVIEGGDFNTINRIIESEMKKAENDTNDNGDAKYEN